MKSKVFGICRLYPKMLKCGADHMHSTLEDQTSKETWRDWAHVVVNGTGILNNW